MLDYRLVIQYHDNVNNRDITELDVKHCLESLSCLYYAFILHDNDFDSSLNRKTLHYHVVVRFSRDLQLRKNMYLLNINVFIISK